MTFCDTWETILPPVNRGEPRYQELSTIFLPYRRRFAPACLLGIVEQRALHNRFMCVFSYRFLLKKTLLTFFRYDC